MASARSSPSSVSSAQGGKLMEHSGQKNSLLDENPHRGLLPNILPASRHHLLRKKPKPTKFQQVVQVTSWQRYTPDLRKTCDSYVRTCYCSIWCVSRQHQGGGHFKSGVISNLWIERKLPKMKSGHFSILIKEISLWALVSYISVSHNFLEKK